MAEIRTCTISKEYLLDIADSYLCDACVDADDTIDSALVTDISIEGDKVIISYEVDEDEEDEDDGEFDDEPTLPQGYRPN
jgi:hypothetical protein